MKNLVVCGGGAAGLIAAITYKQMYGTEVVIIEKNDTLGKKLYATGNGRGNFTNASLLPADYYSLSKNRDLLNTLLQIQTTDAISFYEKLGVFSMVEEERVYPLTEESKTLVKALLYEIERLEIPVLYEYAISSIEKEEEYYVIKSDDRTLHNSIKANKIILALGGAASPQFGSDGSGVAILEKLGVKINPMRPGLSALHTKDVEFHKLHGVKMNCKATVYKDEKVVFTDMGQLLFTDYGISGIVCMNISNYWDTNKKVVIDLLPTFENETLKEELLNRVDIFENRKIADFLLGLVPEKISHILMNKIPKKRISQVDTFDIEMLIESLKKYVPTIYKTRPFSHAQASVGGVELDEVTKYLELKAHKNMYVVGEMLDIIGVCGGYNLHMAYASAVRAVKNMKNKKHLYF